MTSALRFEGDLNVDMNEFQTNLVPFPRLHFMTSSYSPLTQTGKDVSDNSVWELLDTAFMSKNFNVKYSDFDATEDKYMAISVNFRGAVTSKEANSNIQKLKKNQKVSFVEWMPTGFKVGLNKVTCAKVDDDDMMYSQRAYVHWYVGEGMEEGEFSEAREDLGFLEKDYLDVITEQASDEEDDEDGEF